MVPAKKYVWPMVGMAVRNTIKMAVPFGTAPVPAPYGAGCYGVGGATGTVFQYRYRTGNSGTCSGSTVLSTTVVLQYQVRPYSSAEHVTNSALIADISLTPSVRCNASPGANSTNVSGQRGTAANTGAAGLGRGRDGRTQHLCSKPYGSGRGGGGPEEGAAP
eukprot:SAG22_NODE_854_length_6847_cov_3.834469_4_plen_162_part_00